MCECSLNSVTVVCNMLDGVWLVLQAVRFLEEYHLNDEEEEKDQQQVCLIIIIIVIVIVTITLLLWSLHGDSVWFKYTRALFLLMKNRTYSHSNF